MLFNVCVILAWLWVVDGLDWLDLTDWVDWVNFSKVNVFAAFFVREEWTKEIRVLRLMEKYRCVIHFITQYWNTWKVSLIYISEQWQFCFSLDLLSVRSHVLELVVLGAGQEFFVRENLVFVIINIPSQLWNHSKIINVDRVFINVLKNAEFAVFERQFNPIIEIFVCIDEAFSLISASDCITVDDCEGYLNHELFFSDIF